MKNKKKKIVSSFNNKINLYVIKNIEKFLFRKKVKLCTAKAFGNIKNNKKNREN